MSITLTTVSSGYNLSAINDNFQSLQTALNNNILWRTGSVAGEAMMTRNLDMNGYAILNIATDLSDEGSLITVGEADARYVNVSGDTMTGTLNMSGNKLTGLPSSSASSDAVPKQELTAEVSARQSADANLQAQMTGNVPLEASAFSQISWHDQSIPNSVTIPDNKNAWSFGPQMEVEQGQLVTVGTGSTWTIASGRVVEDEDLHSLIADSLTTADAATTVQVDEIVVDSDLLPLSSGITTNSADISALDGRMTAEETKVQSVALGGTGSTTAPAALVSLGASSLFSESYSKSIAASLTTAASSCTFTAAELVCAVSATGLKYPVKNLSATLNVSTVGANGMDTGTVPAAGYVAVYAIYNPTTATAALLAKDCTSAAPTQIYNGSSLPSGYTASTLISIWRTASSQLVVGYQRGRTVQFPFTTIVNLTTQASPATGTFSTSAVVPPGATRTYALQVINADTSTATALSLLSSDSNQYGAVQGNSYNTASCIGAVLTTTSQSMYRRSTTSTGTMAVQVYINGYDF